MPVINIQETEVTSLAPFDITENTVLVPMLYARDFEKDSEGTVTYLEGDVPSAILYKNARQFKSDIYNGGHVVTVDSNPDKTYTMVYELLLKGLRVVVKFIKFDNEAVENTLSLYEAYKLINDAIEDGLLDEFGNKNLFNIKFITTGAYANCGDVCIDESSSEGEVFNTSMYLRLKELAAQRGDAVALVEYKEFFKDEADIIDTINATDTGDDGKFAAAFIPWCTFTATATGSAVDVKLPACHAYLMAFANSVQTNANWFAASGVIRGFVPNLVQPDFNIGEALMHTLQGDSEASTSLNVAVNPVYNAGTYGYKIWGNRVLYRTSGGVNVTLDMYMNFLNVRMLLCDIKKQIYHAAMRVTFEPNDDIVWINFKTLTNSLLDKMKSGRGISWYKWTKEIPEQLATIKATLTIKPIEAVESFDITIVLTDEEASIEEESV